MNFYSNHRLLVSCLGSRCVRVAIPYGLLAVILLLAGQLQRPAAAADSTPGTRRPVVAPLPAAEDGPSEDTPAGDEPLLLLKKTGKAQEPGKQKTSGTRAADEKPLDGKSVTRPQAGQSGQKADGPAGSRIDEELLQELRSGGATGGAKEAGKGADPLSSILERVKEIEERIGRRETGQETQLAQQALITELEQLLKQPPQNQPRQPRGSSGRQSSPDQRQNRQQKDQQKQAAGQKEQSGEPEQTAEGGAAQSKEGQAKDSEETIREQQRQKAELARREQLVRDVWGHLPPVLKQQLLSIGTQTYLPQYEREVRKYFERLSREQRTDSPR